MKWKIIKAEIDKADNHIGKFKDEKSEYYARQRAYWRGVKYGLGKAYNQLTK